jgi:hypothetical protein
MNRVLLSERGESKNLRLILPSHLSFLDIP